MEFGHQSVMLYETVDSLCIKPDGVYVDGTLGGGGHSYEICTKLDENGRLYGIDQDADAIAAATERLAPFGKKVTILRDNYCHAVARLRELGVEGADGIVLDLGVSSYQLDTVSRGFSYKQDAPLDMRMDNRQSLTAREIINDCSETELYHIIRDYG
ncbi:MAG: 16S rRNA (cytosine(1402)-N(4))-methyltransferase RsmH, partial [Lachnospiraceae bacterium]|nr:16S rRNA (cytosine(1402)-N(4))-methyltransferase RsmH [Lachnospiraceae bacterium]